MAEDEEINRAQTAEAQEKAPNDSSKSSAGITMQEWLQVLNTSVVFFNTWGLLLAFGVFQTYYEQVLLTHESRSSISWISTVCAFILMASGMITGPLYDKGYFRVMMLIGASMQVFGLMMVSLSTEYYQVFLAQGLCVGIGGGLIFIPSIAATAASFDGPLRAKIMGLVASFSGLGGIIYPIMFRQILLNAGFPWAVRSIGFVVLGTHTLSFLVLGYEGKNYNTKARPWVDSTAFSDWSFISAALMGFFGSLAYYVPSLYLPLYAETAVKGFDNEDLAFYLISIINAASVVGRLLAGLIATRIGPIETCGLGLVASAVMLFGWVGVHSTAAIIVWSVLWGFCSSVIVAMPGAIIPLITPNLALLGTRSGMFWVFAALGVLIGSPIGGRLTTSGGTEVTWLPLQTFTAAVMLLGALCAIFPTRSIRKKGVGE